MADARIHRSHPDHFVRLANATARDTRLSWAARGYLAEMLANKDGWDPETTQQAAARAKRDRGGDAESARQVQRILAELEAHGYRHRIRRRPGNRSAYVNEIHYYDVPTFPCADALTCAACIKRDASMKAHGGLTEPASDGASDGASDAEFPQVTDISAGQPESAVLLTPADQPKQGVSAGRPESAVSEGSETADSSRRTSIQKNIYPEEIDVDRRAGATVASPAKTAADPTPAESIPPPEVALRQDQEQQRPEYTDSLGDGGQAPRQHPDCRACTDPSRYTHVNWWTKTDKDRQRALKTVARTAYEVLGYTGMDRDTGNWALRWIIRDGKRHIDDLESYLAASFRRAPDWWRAQLHAASDAGGWPDDQAMADAAFDADGRLKAGM